MTQISFTEAAEANELLADNHFALLVGMTLYQQVPVEKAFAGPYVLEQRLGKRLDAETIAAVDPQRLEDLFREKPALHRFPANMAKRTQAVAAYVVDTYDGDPTGLWDGVDTSAELVARVKKLPGFGDYKAKVYAAVLARRFDIKPDGWDKDLPDWPNISEVTSPESLTDMKSRKKAWKATQS
ncbi:MAG: HhH-GPD-type base excision DNA repair protein [Actinomycetota bacterium]